MVLFALFGMLQRMPLPKPLWNVTANADVSCIRRQCVDRFLKNREVNFMNNIIYLVGAVVIVLFILSFVGIV